MALRFSNSDWQALVSLEANASDVGVVADVFAAVCDHMTAPDLEVAFSALGTSACREGKGAIAVFALARLRELQRRDGAKKLLGVIDRSLAKTNAVDGGVPPPLPPKKAAATLPKDLGTSAEFIARARDVFAKIESSPFKPSGRPLFSFVDQVDRTVFLAFCEQASARFVSNGTSVIRVGDNANELFLVARGELDVERDAKNLAMLRSGMFFGEIALLGETTRTANVVARTAAWLVSWRKDVLEATVRKTPIIADLLARVAKQRLFNNVSRTSEIFQRIPVEERDALMARFTVESFDAGTHVVQEGDPKSALRVLVSGTAQVLKDTEVLATLQHGDVFGEMSLLSGQPASATVTATTPLVTLKLVRKDFNSVADQHPELLAEVYKIFVKRQADVSSSRLTIVAEDVVV